MILAGGLCIFLLVKYIQTCEGNCIKIGVISNGRGRVSTGNKTIYNYNVSFVRYLVDTSEVYHIFKSIKALDADVDVDVIILFDYDPSILRMPELLKTTNKKLIKWGDRTHHTEQIDGKRSHYIDPDSICGADQLPDLTIEDPNCIHAYDYNLTLNQRNKRLMTQLGPQTLVDLVKKLLWQTVFIFYETSTETETSDLVDLLSREGVLLSLFNIDNVPCLPSLLERIYQNKIPLNKDINIIVLCRFSCSRKVLQTANMFDSSQRQHNTLLKSFSRFLVAVYGHSKGVSRALRACANDLDNVAVVIYPDFSGNGTEAFHEAFEQILKEEVLEGSVDLKRTMIDKLETMAAKWSPTSKCLAYEIDTLLHTKTGRRFSSVGYVEINGNVAMHSDVFPNTKYGYNKRHFKVTTLPYYPFVDKEVVDGAIIYEGFCIDLLQELAYKLNFTFTLTEPADGKWGTYDDVTNLTFNGLAGQLQREEVDMVAAPIAITSERSKVMDFSYPFFYEYTSVLMKKPDVNAIKWRTLLDPFQWKVLISIAISLPMITILTFLLEKYSPFYDIPKHSEEREHNGGLHTWPNSFWYMYGALLCQGGVHLPDSVAGRTLVSAWWLCCIIIVGIYSGNLIAFLTVTKEKPPFNTLAEMTKLKGSYKWGTSGTNFETFLKSSNPTYRAVGESLRDFKRSDPNVLNADPDVHIRKVKEGQYAWIGDKTLIEIAMATECSLMSIKEQFLPLNYAFGFANNSPHTAVFSKYIMKLHEGRLFQIWKSKWWPKPIFCSGDTVTEAKPISLMDVQSAFYVCFIGVFLGFFVLMLEIIVYKCQTRKMLESTRTKIDNSKATVAEN